jgi:hypothetical protein
MASDGCSYRIPWQQTVQILKGDTKTAQWYKCTFFPSEKNVGK